MMRYLFSYKGYVGKCMYDVMSHRFHGHTLGMKDPITFEGVSATQVEQSFKESVDDYLAWCLEQGIEAERPQEITIEN